MEINAVPLWYHVLEVERNVFVPYYLSPWVHVTAARRLSGVRFALAGTGIYVYSDVGHVISAALRSEPE